MKEEKSYSWKGSPNAGLFLSFAVGAAALIIIIAGFAR